MPIKKQISSLLTNGDFTNAIDILTSSLSNENNIEEYATLHKIIKYWINRDDKLNRINQPYEKALAYFDEWDNFLKFLQENNIDTKISEIHCIHNFVFSKCLSLFIESRTETRINDIDLLIKIAYCFRELSQYEEGIQTLQYAYKLNKNQLISLMLADFLYAKGETLEAQILFKDVFFLDNTISFDTKFVKCDKILEIIEKIKKDNYPEYEILEWIPIYGYIDGFLNVKRQLNKTEFEKIFSEMTKFEKIFYSNPQIKSQVEAKLIKKCILLLEYYTFQEVDTVKQEQIKLKLKNINETIAKQILIND
jgi:tetratricopeptide (TPR) repeat protein